MAILVPSESEESRFEIASSLTLLAMTNKQPQEYNIMLSSRERNYKVNRKIPDIVLPPLAGGNIIVLPPLAGGNIIVLPPLEGGS